MKETETERERLTRLIEQSITFDIHEAEAEVWPVGKPPSVISKGPDRDGVVSVVKHPDCLESEMASMKAMYEKRQQKWRQELRDELAGIQAGIGESYTD